MLHNPLANLYTYKIEPWLPRLNRMNRMKGRGVIAKGVAEFLSEAPLSVLISKGLRQSGKAWLKPGKGNLIQISYMDARRPA